MKPVSPPIMFRHLSKRKIVRQRKNSITKKSRITELSLHPLIGRFGNVVRSEIMRNLTQSGVGNQ